jgi:hypothetical protein
VTPAPASITCPATSHPGANGIGGARDVVLYTANVTYPRMFPLHSMIGLPSNVTVSATTVLRNQPFDEQNDCITGENPCP